MDDLRKTILEKICYTELVYDRINKKLCTSMTHPEIEEFLMSILSDNNNCIKKQGKNYYISDEMEKVSIIINASTYRVITANRLSENNFYQN